MLHDRPFLRYFYCLVSASSMYSFNPPCTVSFNELITTQNSEISALRFWHLSIPSVGLHKKECPYDYIPHLFSLWQLCPSQGRGIKAALLDTGVAAFSTGPFIAHLHLLHPPVIHDLEVTHVHTKFLPLIEEDTLRAAHGTHCYGIINARHDSMPLGLAPHAQVYMIKVSDGRGVSDVAALIRGLKTALRLGCNVVTMALALAEQPSSDDNQIKELFQLMQKIPYIVAPSGNQGRKFLHYPFIVPTMAYPAAYECIAFDVGAFGYDPKHNTYPVCDFSQFKKNYGPKFLEPGFNIVSTSIPTHECKDPYTFLHGTSMASALMTGFVILMLAEFGDNFSRQQLLKVCYTSCIRLHDNQEWNEKALLGTLDMRTALFILHVLNYIKTHLSGKDYSFESHFDNVLKAVQWILHYPVRCFEKKQASSIRFIHNFVDFATCAQCEFQRSKASLFIPGTVDEAVQYIADPLLAVLDAKKQRLGHAQLDETLLKAIVYGPVELFDWLNNDGKKHIEKIIRSSSSSK